MAQRLKLDELTGPAGEKLKVSWMPGNRVRLDFVDCGTVVVTKIFPVPQITHVELSYGEKETPDTD